MYFWSIGTLMLMILMSRVTFTISFPFFCVSSFFSFFYMNKDLKLDFSDSICFANYAYFF